MTHIAARKFLVQKIAQLKIHSFFISKKILFFILGAGFSVNCHAHVKWFIKPGIDNSAYSFSLIEIVFSIFMLTLGIVVAKYLHAYCFKQGGILSSPRSTNPLYFRVSQYVLALYLSGSALSGNLLVPHINLSINAMYFSVVIQIVIALALLLKRWLDVAAALFYLLFFIAGVIDSSFFIEYLTLALIAWVLFSEKNVPNKFAIKILRMTLGISLIALALDEKLLQSELAFNVLAQYPLNFMLYLGLDFSDKWFVLAAGMVELFIGLLFVLGLMVRTTTLVILGLMIASNSYFFCINNYHLAIMELIGHLPIFAIGILLLAYCGSSSDIKSSTGLHQAIS